MFQVIISLSSFLTYYLHSSMFAIITNAFLEKVIKLPPTKSTQINQNTNPFKTKETFLQIFTATNFLEFYDLLMRRKDQNLRIILNLTCPFSACNKNHSANILNLSYIYSCKYYINIQNCLKKTIFCVIMQDYINI